MTNEFLKAEQIVSAGLGLLARAVVLPSLVWRDAAGDFAGAKNDTITIRLPAYGGSARTRQLRSARIPGTDVYTMDALHERGVDVTLDTDVYKAIPVTDEELTLDIRSFGDQILQPTIETVARGMEDELVGTVEDATYEVEIEIGSDPYLAFVDARKALNDANVPMDGRGLICGSSVEAALLKSDHLAKFQESGSSDAFRNATIGRIAGFTAVTVPALAPDEAYAFHRTAYVLSSRAPVVPSGASFGNSASFAGLAMRIIRDYDWSQVQDRLLANSYMGSSVVTDSGHIDSDGKFVPSVDPDDSGEDDIFVRAVKMTLGS